MRLLPQPRKVDLTGGSFDVSKCGGLHLPNGLEAPDALAAAGFADAWNGCCGRPLNLLDVPANGAIMARSENPGSAAGAGASTEGYRIDIRSTGVELIGRSATGLLNGFRTLRQMLESAPRAWPCGIIEDQPDCAVRGLSFDVSRGRVPTLATLKHLVDTLAALKVNLLQLYIEHTFAFRFDPEIGAGCSPLTAGEIRELNAYARARRVWLVPCIASFGHMGRILSLPQYRHLAEIEADKPWDAMTWRERMHGLTLDPCNPESRALLERMYGELLPLFSAPWVNVSGDETYDLGRGRNLARAEKEGIGKLYLEHLHWLHELCARHGKRMLFWGDILKKYPELLRDVPRDAVVLDWWYGEEIDEPALARFREAGLETWACPGTSSWNRVINDLRTAEINIRGFAEAGRRHGVTGLLNTDWGDEGNFNMLATSWHGIYLGAALAWNASAPSPQEFDDLFARMRFGRSGPEKLDSLRCVLDASEVLRTWPLLAAPFEGLECAEEDDARLEEWQQRSLRAADQFAGELDDPDPREIALACRMNALLAQKLRIVRRLQRGREAPDPGLSADLQHFAADCLAAARGYERIWLARCKPERLGEILIVFQRLADEARRLARGLDSPKSA